MKKRMVMSDYIELHAVNPDVCQVEMICEGLRSAAVIAYPTDSGYALGCAIGMCQPLDRIKRIRDLDDEHNFTLICRDLAEITQYAKVDNSAHRILRKCTPGGYTFILPATHRVPKLVQANRKTIGVRIPDHQIALAIAEQLGQPLISTTLIMPGCMDPIIYPEDVSDQVGSLVDIVIDGGYCGFEPTTVVDLAEGKPQVRRQGSGDVGIFL